MAETKDIVPKEETGGPIVAFDYGADAGAGSEDQTADDFQIPFIAIIQDLSPQHKKKRAEYIEGAEVGDLYNNVTNELLDQGFEFVPALRIHCFVEWVPRDKGGGFIGRHDPNSEIVKRAKAEAEKFGKYKTPDGNDLMETFYLWGIIAATLTPAIIAFTSTKIRVYKKWNTARSMIKSTAPDGTVQDIPIFANRILVRTAEESRGDNDYFNFVLEPPINGSVRDSLIRDLDDARYQKAKALRDDVVGGRVTADYSQAEGGGGAAEDDDDAPF